MEAEHHGALYFEKNRNHILKFQENLKKNLDLDNVVFYQPAKSQIKIFHILGYTKMAKSDRFGRVEVLHYSLLSNVRLCHFCAAQNTTYV